jgi:hypothetical protein
MLMIFLTTLVIMMISLTLVAAYPFSILASAARLGRDVARHTIEYKRATFRLYRAATIVALQLGLIGEYLHLDLAVGATV